jgi:two-component system OmpR family response regulator
VPGPCGRLDASYLIEHSIVHPSAPLNAAPPLKVLLVEDSAVLQERLRELLDHVPGIDLIAIVDSERAAVTILRSIRIDVLLLDLHLKQGTGFGILRATADLPRRAVTVVLTNFALPQYQREAHALGVRYFLDKANEFDRIPDVLREVAETPAR